tara:strand:- start:2209 stop:5628 length:3420 start_codon:yes stop_codon:yes gene_type:complete
MATYLPGIKQYIPQLKTFTPDYKFLQDVLQKRQDRYTTNYNELNDLYGKVVYADLSRKDNQQVRDQYANQLTEKLEQVSGTDLSLQGNVDAAKALFRPFYEDKHIVKDILFTKTYQDQQRYAQSLMNSPDPKVRKKYWDYGMEGLQMDMEKFQNSKREETLNLANPTYVENVDLVNRGIEALKESDMSITKTTPVGNWLVTVKNGPNLTSQIVGYEEGPDGKPDKSKPITNSPAMDYLQQTLLEDPLVIRAYALKAKVDGNRFAKANADKFGSYDAAVKEWAKATLDKYKKQDEKLLTKVQADLIGATADNDSWERYKQKMGIVPGSKQEEQLLRKQYNKRLLNQTMNMKVKNHKELSQPSTNLQNYLNLAYKAQMMGELGGDMASAAIAYSNIDYEETFEANPFIVKQHEHLYRMKEKKFAHDLAMIKQADKYAREAILKDQEEQKAKNGDGVIFGENGVTYGEDDMSVELSQMNWFDQQMETKKGAYDKLNKMNVDFIKTMYDGSKSFSDIVRDGNPPGMITYNKAITDEFGNVLRNEEVTGNFEQFAQDMMKFENKTELDRIYQHAYKLYNSVDETNDGSSERSNADRLLDPQFQKSANQQIRAIDAFKERMNLADETLNSSVYQQYRLLTDAEDQTNQVGGNKGGYAGKFKEKGIGSRDSWHLFGRGEGVLQEAWGMHPIVLPDKMVDEMMNGMLYNDIKGNYKYDKYKDGKDLVMLSEDQYVQSFINSLAGQADKVKTVSDNPDNYNLWGFKEQKSDLMSNTNPQFLDWDSQKSYGQRGQPTILGKFWDYDSKKGWSLDKEAADYYAREYYRQQKGWMGDRMTAANTGEGGMPTGNYYALLNGLPGGDTAGDATFRGNYGFSYDHKTNQSEASQLALQELNNMVRINNMTDDLYTFDIGKKGTDLPFGEPFKGDDDDAKNLGKWQKDGANKIEFSQLVFDYMIQEMGRQNKTQGAPQVDITRRENVIDGGGEWGSYEMTLGRDFANNFIKGRKEELKTEYADEMKKFIADPSITYYFKREVDGSPYKTSEIEYSDIKILVDRDGVYHDTYDKAGDYSITRNNYGQYEIISNPLRFDYQSGTLVPGPTINKVLDPKTMNLDMVVQNMDVYFENLHKHNLANEVKYNKANGVIPEV